MTKKSVVIAGATGALGRTIVKELANMNVTTRALVRPGTSPVKLNILKDLGCEVLEVDLSDHKKMVGAMQGSSVVISALAGLGDVIIDGQTRLLKAAEDAQVPRFIPSDFSIDFTKIPVGSNRNLNLRLEFMRIADHSKVRITSILNGAFMDMLRGVAPLVLFRFDRILCWGDPDQLMDWTTMGDTAKYTAFAALDETTPRFLRIAGEEISAKSLAADMTTLTGREHKIFQPGGLKLFKALIRFTKFLVPGSQDLYPPWQGMQYMENLYSGVAKFEQLDNDRYPMSWTKAKDVLAETI